jgi:hypothetical protein
MEGYPFLNRTVAYLVTATILYKGYLLVYACLIHSGLPIPINQILVLNIEYVSNVTQSYPVSVVRKSLLHDLVLALEILKFPSSQIELPRSLVEFTLHLLRHLLHFRQLTLQLASFLTRNED